MIALDGTGRLVYRADSEGNYVPDFSHAGYMGGGVPIPQVPVKVALRPGDGDDSASIQAAIDEVSRLPRDSEGFRGAVLLERGRFILDQPIVIRTGGVILRGEGQDEDGTVLFGRGVIAGQRRQDGTGAALIRVEGACERRAVGPSLPVVDEFVPTGSRVLTVADAAGLSIGDPILVRRLNTPAWYRIMDLDDRAPLPHECDRIVIGLEGNTISLDVSLPCPILARWGAGEVSGYTESGRIDKVGIENLRGVSDFDRSLLTSEYSNMDRQPFVGPEYYCDEDHYFELVRIDGASDCWVRDVTGRHFVNSVVFLGDRAKRCTVQDCESLDPVSRCGGGRRFTFQISGQLCLVQRCRSDRGRHSFVLGGESTCGPNVFLDCSATRPFSSSEPHSSLVVGSLYDSVRAPIALRFARNMEGRWMGIHNYLWNCEGDFLCQKPPVGQNYAFGQIGVHALVFNTRLQDHRYPNGHIESWDEHLEPRSLYLKQLEERLGWVAVEALGA